MSAAAAEPETPAAAGGAAQPEQCIRNIARLFQESYPGRGGRIARSELLRFLALVTHGGIADTSLEQVVDAADKDKTGMVQIEDFLAWLFSQAKINGTEDVKPPWPTGSLRASLDTPRLGMGTIYLATLKKEVPHIDQLQERSDPAFEDTLERFREQHADDKTLLGRLVNKVKVCAVCGKPCAYTLTCCNSCGADITNIAISHTDNVFMGFIHGVAKGRFPYTISLRSQSPDVLCFDDPLAVTVCHLNAIPTDVYVPDMRYLFADPPRGLAILNKLWEVASTAALEQFWGDDSFRRRFFADEPRPASGEALLDTVLTGLNCPPSMYQLHLQFIHPPLLPFHYNLFMQDAHFHYGRFFPLEYLRKALALGDAVKMDVTDSTTIEEIMRKTAEHCVEYDSYHAALVRKCKDVQRRFSPWEEADFAHQVINGKVFSLLGGVSPVTDKEAKVVQAEDTKVLQNYGRPYGANGKPTGTFYRYPKKAGEVASFVPGSGL